MRSVIITNVNQIDWNATFIEVNVHENLRTALSSDGVVLVDVANSSNNLTLDDYIYIPIEMLAHLDVGNSDKGQVYLELDLYPFFHQIKQIVSESKSKKSVFRLRRTFTHKYNEWKIVGDILTLHNLFGEIEQLFVKNSKGNENPRHVIVTIHYKNGTMVHIDYTFSDIYRIEVEWSGIGKIIEFNSLESSPVLPPKENGVPLMYNVETILNQSSPIDTQLLGKIATIKERVKGADKK